MCSYGLMEKRNVRKTKKLDLINNKVMENKNSQDTQDELKKKSTKGKGKIKEMAQDMKGNKILSRETVEIKVENKSKKNSKRK